MDKILKIIDGNKTYLTLALAAIVYSLKYFGVIDEHIYEYLMTIDALLIGGAVRSALKKIK